MRQTELPKSKVLPRIVIPAGDYARLMAIAGAVPSRMSQVSDYLERELSRAKVVADDKAEAHIVRVGSQVTYRDEFDGRQRTITVVWPHEADVDQGRVSVLTPIGAALLGMGPGQSIDWPSPVDGARSLTVLAVSRAAMPPDSAA